MTTQPVIAVLYRIPLLVEALRHALDGLGDVRAFKSPTGDPLRLLESLRPDAIVVDGERDAAAALAYSREARIPALYVPWQESMLRTAVGESWETIPGDPSPEVIRNLLESAFVGARIS